MEREVKFLGKLLGEVERPFVADHRRRQGLATRSACSRTCSARVDALLIGGAMANTFLKAKGGKLGKSLVEEDKLALARAFLRKAEERERRGAAAARRGGGGGHRRPSPAGSCRRRASPRIWRRSTSARRRRAASPTRSRAPRRSSGTGRWACSSRSRSPPARWRSRKAVAAAARRAHGRRRRRLGRGDPRRAAWPTRSRTSRRAAAHRSSSSRARRCRASRRWRVVEGRPWPPDADPSSAATGSCKGSIAESLALATDVRTASPTLRDVEVAVAPGFTALLRGRQAARGRPVARRRRRTASGRTRARSPARSRRASCSDVGCSYVIVGHSERRQLFGELDAAVNLKARAALRAGLAPIVCVGETLAERDAGETFGRVQAQLDAALAEHRPRPTLERVVIAYEPVWAIGTGRTATPAQAQEVHRFIRAPLGASAAAVAPTDAHPVRRQREARQRRALWPSRTSTAAWWAARR